MFEMFQLVRSTVAVPFYGLGVGAIGQIVDIYKEPRPAFEVEFMNEAGETLGLSSMAPNEIEAVGPAAHAG